MRAHRRSNMGLVLGVLGVAIGAGAALAARRRVAHPQLPRRIYDYGDRSGFPRPAEEMRGKWKQRPLS
jgi:hypothetical protein